MDLFCLHQNYKEDACCQKAMSFFPPLFESLHNKELHAGTGKCYATNQQKLNLQQCR